MTDADVVWQAYDEDGDCVQLLRLPSGRRALQVVSHWSASLHVFVSDADLRTLTETIHTEGVT